MAIRAEQSGPGLARMAMIAEHTDSGTTGKRTAWLGSEPYVILVTRSAYFICYFTTFVPSLSY